MDSITINNKQYTPEEYAIVCGFGISYKELVDWVEFHCYCNTFGGQAVCKWIEDFFTEINYHQEALLLKQGNYSKILNQGDINYEEN